MVVARLIYKITSKFYKQTKSRNKFRLFKTFQKEPYTNF